MERRNRTVFKALETQTRWEKSLVTGGAGFIGSHLVDALISRGSEVIILDNLSSGNLANIETHLCNGEAQLVKGDVRNARDVKSALGGVEAVFHLAAIVSVPYSIENPTITHEVNSEGTRNVLEACISKGVKHFVYVSSSAVYGEPEYLPIDENHPTDPLSPYAKSKMKGEEYCRKFQEEYGLKTSTLRLFNVYGLRQVINEYSGVIMKFITQIEQRNQPLIYGDGEQTRDFIHVSDIVQALLLSTNDKATGQTFNIGTGTSVTINDLCQLLLTKLRAEMKPLHTEARSGEIRHSIAKIDKARRVIGFNPKVPLERGLEDLTRKWVCELA